MSYYKKAKLYAIICALLVVAAAVLTLTFGLPAKAPFTDSTILTVQCVDTPLDFTALDDQLAQTTDLPYTVVPGKDLSGAYEAANITFDGAGFTSVDAQSLVSTLGASYSVLSLNTVAGNSASGMVAYLVFTGVASLLAAGIYLAFRYGFKTAVSALVPALGAVGAALSAAVIIGTGLSYPLAVALVGSLLVSLFFSALAFGQARELHEVKHVIGHDDVAEQTGAALMPRNLKIALFAAIVFATVGAAGFIFNIPDLPYTAFPLLIGVLVGLFGAQLCAVPLCMKWQIEASEALLKKKTSKKSAKTVSKSGDKSAKPAAKTPAKKSAAHAKKNNPAKSGKSGAAGKSRTAKPKK